MVDLVVTLDDAKEHLRIDFNDDDTLIESMLAAAEEACRAYLGLAAADPAPEVLGAAIKMHLTRLYEDRDGGSVPAEAQDLLREHRAWEFGG
ncbi:MULTISPECIES: head-tail connector protein [unclassified Brevundimonas]|uniref:head-tail connector protein n=1 Tax=unclassified Brevundimonas TaxID=2622653 RepID=UPI0025C5446B|nr:MULTISPECIES: head-tail connector protein [unclassified Brevundimonas]